MLNPQIFRGFFPSKTPVWNDPPLHPKKQKMPAGQTIE